MDTSRTEMLIGSENVEKLKNAKVLIVGVGGVGGITAEMLVRTGIGNISLVDFDTVSTSNINRQIIALNNNVGQVKVEALKERLLSINPHLNVNIHNIKLSQENAKELVTKEFNYVIDAIDILKDKTALICFAKSENIPIISALGAGNRTINPVYQISDIYKTENDGLAKALRKSLRENGIKKHKVCYSNQLPLKSCGGVGSVMWHPTACACVLASEVVNDIIKGEN